MAFVSTLRAQKVADCVTLSSSLSVSRVSRSSLVRAASTTPAWVTSHLWWRVVDASSTGGPKATATGARPTLRRARHRARSSPRQPRPAEMGVGADLQQARREGLGKRERESSGRQASAAQRAIHYKYRRRISALMGLDVCFQTRYF